MVKTIADVDTTQTGDFADLPSGWSTPAGGGLHLTTTYEVDALGRTTKETDPNGDVTYTVYNDADARGARLPRLEHGHEHADRADDRVCARTGRAGTPRR